MIYIVLSWLLAPLWWPLQCWRGWRNPSPRRIVVLEYAGIGDVVCSAALFERLREQYPSARIDLLLSSVASSMASALAMFDQVHVLSDSPRGLAGRMSLAWRLRQYDTALCLIPGAALLTSLCWAAIPRRLSVLPLPLNRSYRWLAPLLSGTAEHVRGQYFPDTQARLFAQLPDFPLLTGLEKRFPAIKGDARTVAPLDDAVTWLGLLVSSGRELKRLDPTWMAAFIEGALAAGYGVVLIGGPADRVLAADLTQEIEEDAVGRLLDRTGSLPLSVLPSLLRQLAVFVGVDSGVTHMADALGIPIVCLAGPVDTREVYLSSPSRKIIAASIPCHPCSTVFATPNHCHAGHMQCLRALHPDKTLDVVRMLLKA